MIKQLRLVLPVMLYATTLPGCQPATTPVSATTLPTLERPVVAIKFKSNDRIMVPSVNITKRGGITGVFVLQNNQARFRMIKTGKRVVNHVEILSGLDGSETLVGGDLEPVHDGSPVSTL